MHDVQTHEKKEKKTEKKIHKKVEKTKQKWAPTRGTGSVVIDRWYSDDY